MSSRSGPRSSPSLKPHLEAAASPPSITASPKTASKPCLLIREPSFAYGCESIFEVQSAKQNAQGTANHTFFYAGTSLHSSQILSPEEVFPIARECRDPQCEEVLISTDFAVHAVTPPAKVYMATKQPVTTLFNSSVVHPPEFVENDARRQNVGATRTGLAQRLGRLKKPSDGEAERLRGLSSPSLDRGGSGSGLRRLSPVQSKPRPPVKKAKSKGAIFSPLEFSLNSAYLPTLKPFDGKKVSPLRKPQKPLVSKRPKSLTPDSRLN